MDENEEQDDQDQTLISVVIYFALTLTWKVTLTWFEVWFIGWIAGEALPWWSLMVIFQIGLLRAGQTVRDKESGMRRELVGRMMDVTRTTQAILVNHVGGDHAGQPGHQHKETQEFVH